MPTYDAAFEKNIRELSERLKECDTAEEMVLELTEAEEKTGKLIHAMDAKDAVLRAKTQIWAYKKILDGYKQSLGTREDMPENSPTNLPTLVEEIQNESRNIGGGHINLGSNLHKIAEKMYACTSQKEIEEADNLYDKLILLSAKIIRAAAQEVEELEETLEEETEAESTLIQDLG